MLSIQQGTTSAVVIPLTVADLDGWTFRAQIRESVGASDVLVEWPPGEIEARPYALVLPVDPVTSGEWSWSRGVLGVEATSPAGAVTRVCPHTPVVLSRELVRDREV